MATKHTEKMDMQAMMEACEKLALPGREHKILERLSGTWDCRGQCWADLNQPPVEVTGTSEYTMILEGRYLHQEHTSQMMGRPFKGYAVLGYDNQSKKYVSTWIDTMGTGIMLFEGNASPDGKTLTQTSRWNHPIKGPMTFRNVYRFIDQDRHTFEMYGKDNSGKEEKLMECTYTRRG